eukprot:6665971-Ditylum_brightwellii.AAC.1
MSTPTDVEKCDTCPTCEMKESAREQGDTRVDATTDGQGISLTLSQTTTQMQCGHLVHQKPPVSYLNKLLTKFECKGEFYALMNLGGKLGKHPE